MAGIADSGAGSTVANSSVVSSVTDAAASLNPVTALQKFISDTEKSFALWMTSALFVILGGVVILIGLWAMTKG